MPYACHKCGSTIEEGTAFCPHCGAPQIRVAIPAAIPNEDSPAFIPGTPAEMQPPAEPVPLHSIAMPPLPGSIHWRAALSTIGIAGAITGLASLLPLGILWVIAGGILVVVLYRKRHPEAWPLTSGSGAKLGAATGLIAYLIFSIIAAFDFTRPNSTWREAIVTALQQAAARNSDPAAQEIYQKMISPEGMAIVVTFLMAFLFVLFLGFGAIGGAIGASATRRNRP